jgi:hypothetical protein
VIAGPCIIAGNSAAGAVFDVVALQAIAPLPAQFRKWFGVQIRRIAWVPEYAAMLPPAIL